MANENFLLFFFADDEFSIIIPASFVTHVYDGVAKSKAYAGFFSFFFFLCTNKKHIYLHMPWHDANTHIHAVTIVFAKMYAWRKENTLCIPIFSIMCNVYDSSTHRTFVDHFFLFIFLSSFPSFQTKTACKFFNLNLKPSDSFNGLLPKF